MQININLNARVQALLIALGLACFGWFMATQVDPKQFTMLNFFAGALSFASAAGTIGCLIYAIVCHLDMMDTKGRGLK